MNIISFGIRSDQRKTIFIWFKDTSLQQNMVEKTEFCDKCLTKSMVTVLCMRVNMIYQPKVV